MKEAVLDGSEAPETNTGATPPAAPEAAPKKKGTDWWGEIKGIFWLVLIVLGFHSFIAKPFYIPSESMMPGLMCLPRASISTARRCAVIRRG